MAELIWTVLVSRVPVIVLNPTWRFELIKTFEPNVAFPRTVRELFKKALWHSTLPWPWVTRFPWTVK